MSMKRGTTEIETLALNGWGVGTYIRGYEAWGNGKGRWDTWRITCIGEDTVLARTVAGDGSESHEHSVTLRCREWAEVADPTEASGTQEGVGG